MIIVRIMGGLGNQLFQYAAGRAAARRSNSTFKLDISWFSDPRNIHRPYRLNKFDIIESVATDAEIEMITWEKRKGFGKRIFNLVQRSKPYFKRRMVREQQFNFDPGILKLPRTVYLDGYWQSEKYFKDVEKEIRDDLSLKPSPDEENKAILDEIKENESVGIHVRRYGKRWSGDLTRDPDDIEFHGVCSLEYYDAAIETVMKKVKEPHFFVFSDYIDWARDHLKYDLDLSFVDHNGEEGDYEDLRLMSNCKHHIIANSTFSWWGAWLSENPSKIVVAPKKWFVHEEMNNQTKDLIPETWIRL